MFVTSFMGRNFDRGGIIHVCKMCYSCGIKVRIIYGFMRSAVNVWS